MKYLEISGGKLYVSSKTSQTGFVIRSIYIPSLVRVVWFRGGEGDGVYDAVFYLVEGVATERCNPDDSDQPQSATDGLGSMNDIE